MTYTADEISNVLTRNVGKTGLVWIDGLPGPYTVSVKSVDESTATLVRLNDTAEIGAKFVVRFAAVNATEF